MNNDGVLNILDVVGVVNFILDPDEISLTEDEQAIADINGDGVVNVLDVVGIVDQVLEA